MKLKKVKCAIILADKEARYVCLSQGTPWKYFLQLYIYNGKNKKHLCIYIRLFAELSHAIGVNMQKFGRVLMVSYETNTANGFI